MENKYFGPIYAKVTNNTDPEKQGRVKVSFDVLGDTMESDWLDVMVSYSGTLFIPEVEDQVVVAFLNGNLNNGVVLGGIWSGAKKPPESGENSGADLNEGGTNVMKYLRTKGSNRIIFNDEKGDEKLQIINSMGINRLELLTNNSTIKLSSINKVVINASKQLKIKAEQGILKVSNKLKLNGKPVVVEGKQNITLKAGQLAEVKGKTVKLN